ncbi:transcriptional regulator, LysR family [Shewanella denitrificans OS217]|uniref:Transcriptional regulator, LysR family n=1 Tax=Shewanella denitrificans (strain OS217 / ATCC BAA-1090 / DSM 15013) TaxID=318161 RepID=Q12LT7_SHEDO|nr:HTH-type transcriptional regulator HdfR [Shewanella denitrificans]ABE55589.1 transcriptional regulator, LysR family [Shewanella denitrificans OS217]
MDTDLLKTFLEVSRTRHFGKAAENLYLTRSAVSFRVKQLEGILGVELFERLRNNIHPTPAGERLLGHAEAVLTAWERAKQDISLSQNHTTQLTLAAGHNIWDAYLQQHLQPLHLGLPGAALRAEILTSTIMTRQLIERTLDIAITFEPPKLDEVEIVQLAQIELSLVSDKPHASLQEAQQQAYIKVDWGTAFNIMHAQEFSLLPVPVLHTSSARIALDFLLNNGGSAFLPNALIIQALSDKKLNLVQGVQSIKRTLYAAYLGKSERLLQIEQAIRLLSN